MTPFWLFLIVGEVALAAWLLWKMPDWSRPEMLFGVTVPRSVREGEAGQAVVAVYRRWVVGSCVVAAGLTAALAFGWAERWASWAPAALGALLVGLVAGFFAARRRALGWAAEPAASNAPPEPGSAKEPDPWRALRPHFLPLILLAVAAVALAALWPRIPERFAIHFGPSGEADGWADRSVLAVFGPLLIGLATWATVFGSAALVAFAGAAQKAEAVRRLAVVRALAPFSWLVVLVFVPIAAMPLATDPRQQKLAVVATLILSILGAMTATVWMLLRLSPLFSAARRTAEAAPAGAAPFGDRTPDRCWKGGLVYYNPDDPALLVERRIGIGYTFNFARPAAWWAMAGIVVLPIAIILGVAFGID